MIVFDQAALNNLFNSGTGPVAKDLQRRANTVTAEAKRSLAQGGKGRQYGRHRASAPGDPPATDTGRLVTSIGNELATDEKGLHARVGTNVKYALFLELGTRRMAPRPFLRRALAKAGR